MRITKPLWSVAVLSLVVWVFVLPTTQPSQRLRREVESDLLGGQIERAIQEMSAHDRQSFPPSWDPPPWPGYGQDSPSLLKVLQEINNDSVAEWVQGIYFDKLALQFERYESAFSFWNSLDDEEFAEYMIFFRSNSKTQELIRRHSVTLRRYFEYSTQQENGRAKSFRLLLKDLAIEIPEVEEPIHEPSPDEVDQAAESVDKVSNENQ